MKKREAKKAIKLIKAAKSLNKGNLWYLKVAVRLMQVLKLYYKRPYKCNKAAFTSAFAKMYHYIRAM